MPINRKGKPCRAKVKTQCGCSDQYIEAGREGKILATRTKEQRALVKWKGKSGPSDHPLSELEW